MGRKRNPEMTGQINVHKANAIMLCAMKDITLSSVSRILGWPSCKAHIVLSNQKPLKKNMLLIAEALGVTEEELHKPIDLARYGFLTVPRHM